MCYERLRSNSDCADCSECVSDRTDADIRQLLGEIAVLLETVATLKEMYRISSSRLEKAMCEIKALKDEIDFYESTQKVRFINDRTGCA